MNGLTLLGLVAGRILQDEGITEPKEAKIEPSKDAVALGREHPSVTEPKNTYSDLHEFGLIQYKIIENRMCKFSKHTGWHLKRSEGMMKIKISLRTSDLVHEDQMIIRALLVRKDETYRHFGIDTICKNHRGEVDPGSINHVLQAAPGLDGRWGYETQGLRNSLYFLINTPPPNSQTTEEIIGLRCICNDSCSTCSDPSFKPTESARDLLLVLTLESLDTGTIHGRKCLVVWPKAVVRIRDLEKGERRKPKGGAAQWNMRQEVKKKSREENRDSSQLLTPELGTQTHPPYTGPDEKEQLKHNTRVLVQLALRQGLNCQDLTMRVVKEWQEAN